jgi:hypothetical protein
MFGKNFKHFFRIEKFQIIQVYLKNYGWEFSEEKNLKNLWEKSTLTFFFRGCYFPIRKDENLEKSFLIFHNMVFAENSRNFSTILETYKFLLLFVQFSV